MTAEAKTKTVIPELKRIQPTKPLPSKKEQEQILMGVRRRLTQQHKENRKGVPHADSETLGKAFPGGRLPRR